jgi:hypothetical protein
MYGYLAIAVVATLFCWMLSYAVRHAGKIDGYVFAILFYPSALIALASIICAFTGG